MIRVRRHTRQLGSGKTVSVRQHERAGDPAAEDRGITAPSQQDDGWWDNPATDASLNEGDFPPGTWFFNQGDDTYAVHPDGTVHQVLPPESEPESEPEPEPPAEHPAGTWYVSDHGETYAVYPDGSTHLVPQQPQASGPGVSYAEASEPDDRTLDYTLADDEGDGTAQDVPFSQDGLSSHPQAEDCSLTRETPEGTETLPVDPSVPRCAEDRGAWGGPPQEAGDSAPASPAAIFHARNEALKEREGALHRAQAATTRDEYDAASRDYKAANEKFKALPDPLDGQVGRVVRKFRRRGQ